MFNKKSSPPASPRRSQAASPRPVTSTSIGITVGSLWQPFFVTIAKGAEAKAKR